MKKINIALTTIGLALSLLSCAQNNSNSTIPAEDFMKQLVETKNEYLLDVRTPGEFNDGHLNNAVNIDYNSSQFQTEIAKLDKSRPVFVYCLSGGRSANAAHDLEQKGFKVINMKGGIMQWKAKNFPLHNSNPATASAASWKGMTMEEFDQITNSNIPVLVDFKAAWCGPCKQLKPILEELQSEYQGKLKVVYIDVDENKSLADKMKISSIPLMVYYKNGKVAMNIEGYADKSSIKRSLKL
jgi:thioredoxin 1